MAEDKAQPISMIAARSLNNVIGRGSLIPWRVDGEQRLFREITLGNTLIMGSRTFDSIGRVLPGRDTVVITRSGDYKAPCHIAHCLDDALDLAKSLMGNPFIAGGGEIYRLAFDRTEILHLTTIMTEVDGDIWFPEFNQDDFTVTEERTFRSNINYRYQKLIRNPQE